MTTTLPIPSDDLLPAALAELMGFRIVFKWLISGTHVTDSPEWPGVICEKFSPLTDLNHSRICKEACMEISIPSVYAANLRRVMGYLPRNSFEADSPLPLAMCETGMLFATPAQESRAAYLTLSEARAKGDAR